MRRLLPMMVLLPALGSGCASCGAEAEPDAGPDGDVMSDADELQDAEGGWDADGDDAEEDSDVDMGTDAEGDAGGLPEPEPVEMVEVPHDRPGLDCGPGCRQVTFATSIWSYDIGEEYLVYTGEGESGEYRPIHIVDLETFTEYRVDACEVTQCGSPAIEGSSIVYRTVPWDDHRDNTLWLYKIGEPTRRPLVRRYMTNRNRTMVGLDIHNDLVAWYDSAIDPAGLYAMSLEGGEVISLTPERCVCYGDPHLFGRKVVYDGWPTGRDIWMVDVDTLEQDHLVDHPEPQFNSAFDGQWVVWTDSRNDPSGIPYHDRINPDIYGMNLETREVEPLCDHPAAQLYPDVRDGLVVWKDWRNADDPNDTWDFGANGDIYLLDLETRREVQVTSRPVSEGAAKIWGRRVFFVSRDAIDQGAVFMVDLEEAGLLEPGAEGE